MRSRLESPARRRNSSAESPGPSNVMSVVQRALQPALQPPMHPPLQSQLHSQLEMQSYSHLCLAKLCIPVGNRASLPAIKPTGQSAADSPKGSRQVLADVAGHLEPEQRSAAATVSRRIAFFIKDSESSATRRDLFDNFLYGIRSPLHLSRLHKYFQLPTCSTQARRLHKTGLQP